MFSPLRNPNPTLTPGVQQHPRYSSPYAKGGRTKRVKMIIAHFNPKELDALDLLQGKREEDPKTGMRSYSHLEELLKNPHILKNLFQYVGNSRPSSSPRKPHAEGGHLHDYKDDRLNKMADLGVHGDTELGLIGPHTKNVFDTILGITEHQPQHNPHSKHPHYAFLDNIIGGMGKILSPVISPMTSALGHFVPPVLDTISGFFGGGGSKPSPSAATPLTPAPSPTPPPAPNPPVTPSSAMGPTQTSNGSMDNNQRTVTPPSPLADISRQYSNPSPTSGSPGTLANLANRTMPKPDSFQPTPSPYVYNRGQALQQGGYRPQQVSSASPAGNMPPANDYTPPHLMPSSTDVQGSIYA